MTDDELAHFRNHGYVIVRGALSEADFAPIEADYSALIAAKVDELMKAGLLTHDYAGESFEERLAKVSSELGPALSKEHLGPWGLSLDTMYARQKSVFDFFFSPRLLGPITSIVGPEVTLSPIQHLRPYLPSGEGGAQLQVGAATLAPWHQDQGVTREEADASDILTCWIPFVDVQKETGCLQVLPDTVGARHAERVLLPHVKGDYGTQIAADALPATTPFDCAMNRGDMLLMSAFTPHRGQLNCSNKVRWSIDLRFQKTGTPTGRHFWPEFILQSKAAPESVQADYAEWVERWVTMLETADGERWHRVLGDVGGAVPGHPSYKGKDGDAVAAK